MNRWDGNEHGVTDEGNYEGMIAGFYGCINEKLDIHTGWIRA